ncbi:mucin-related protein [Artemisia annua]|uniref:Mucin-related protein n=1 Tax=Artemisia annua TaxID=35608 RepID=A0A2U1L8C4_ARTAN|nr:mucin-related protein [Artemisia annua]
MRPTPEVRNDYSTPVSFLMPETMTQKDGNDISTPSSSQMPPQEGLVHLKMRLKMTARNLVLQEMTLEDCAGTEKLDGKDTSIPGIDWSEKIWYKFLVDALPADKESAHRKGDSADFGVPFTKYHLKCIGSNTVVMEFIPFELPPGLVALACRTFYSLIKSSPITTTTRLRRLSTKATGGRDEWNDAWETAWLPEDLSAKNQAPWETDVSFSYTPPKEEEVLDTDTKAFVEDMADNWEQRRKKGGTSKSKREQDKKLMKLKEDGKSLYRLENVKRDYRAMKQRVHAGLWVYENEKMEEAKLGGSAGDLDRFFDTAEIFESGSSDLNNSKVRDSWDLKNKSDGWETTSKGEEDGNISEMSQSEEDILVQEYEHRIAFSKFQIASFIKQHIFSRSRPMDGWKYMIEELGPNAKRGSKGSVSRLPSLADPATQPLKEDKIPIATTNTRGTAISTLQSVLQEDFKANEIEAIVGDGEGTSRKRRLIGEGGAAEDEEISVFLPEKEVVYPSSYAVVMREAKSPFVDASPQRAAEEGVSGPPGSVTQLIGEMGSLAARLHASYADEAGSVMRKDAEIARLQAQLAEARAEAESSGARAERLAGEKVALLLQVEREHSLLESHQASSDDPNTLDTLGLTMKTTWATKTGPAI